MVTVPSVQTRRTKVRGGGGKRAARSCCVPSRGGSRLTPVGVACLTVRAAMTYDLSQLGWDDLFASAFAPFDRADARPGRVLRADRGVCTVLDADGVTRATLAGSVLLDAARDPVRLPCAGDWVVV